LKRFIKLNRFKLGIKGLKKFKKGLNELGMSLAFNGRINDKSQKYAG